MKKIGLIILGILFSATLCFAQDYYALVEVLIKNDAGMSFIMNTITKVADQKTGERILQPIQLLKDKYSVRTECVSGPKWDKLFKDIFANKPTAAIYVSYKDPNGHQTRINTKVLAGANSSTPGVPVDPPQKEIVLWANAMIEALKKGGIKNAKIIYPLKK